MSFQRFLADAMLSRLARWLRMLGISVAAPVSGDDDDLIRHCLENRLVLLTRDKEMFQKAGNYCLAYLIKSVRLEGQITEVCNEFNISLKTIKTVPSESICPICNGKLVRVKKKSIKSRVPSKSFKNAKKFLQCRRCKKIYWEGSHNVKIKKMFGRLKRRQNVSDKAIR